MSDTVDYEDSAHDIRAIRSCFFVIVSGPKSCEVSSLLNFFLGAYYGVQTSFYILFLCLSLCIFLLHQERTFSLAFRLDKVSEVCVYVTCAAAFKFVALWPAGGNIGLVMCYHNTMYYSEWREYTDCYS